MRKITVGIVEDSSGLGGSAKCVYQFARAISRDKFNLHVFAKQESGWYRRLRIELPTQSIRFSNGPSTLPATRSNAAIRYLRAFLTVIVLLKKLPYFIRAFRADDLDIVHTNNGLRWHIAPIIAAKLLSIPIICHLQGQDPMTSLDRLLIPAVDRFIVLNNQALSLYRQYISPNKIVVIPNAVITDDYSTASPCATKFQIKSPAVGVVGRLVRWKGQDTLVRAIPHVLKEVPNATFYIVGAADPPDESDFEDQLKALASELGVTSSVVFTGWANDTKPIFKQLDVSVCSSINPEPFGLVLVESMVLGTPVVATRQGGPLDIITDEKDGLLYDPGNHVALSKSIIKLLTDVELRQKMSLAGREKVLKKFSLEAVMRKLEATYVSLLSEVH